MGICLGLVESLGEVGGSSKEPADAASHPDPGRSVRSNWDDCDPKSGVEPERALLTDSNAFEEDDF